MYVTKHAPTQRKTRANAGYFVRARLARSRPGRASAAPGAICLAAPPEALTRRSLFGGAASGGAGGAFGGAAVRRRKVRAFVLPNLGFRYIGKSRGIKAQRITRKPTNGREGISVPRKHSPLPNDDGNLVWHFSLLDLEAECHTTLHSTRSYDSRRKEFV